MVKRIGALAGWLMAASLLVACAQMPSQPVESPPAHDLPVGNTAEPATIGAPPGPAATDPVTEPQPTEQIRGQLGPVYIDEAELVMLESFPVQVRLVLRGSLPNPCSEFLWQVEPPDEQGRITVQAYSRQESELACIQVLQPLEETIPLGNYTDGKFSVWVNGEMVGEFEL